MKSLNLSIKPNTPDKTEHLRGTIRVIIHVHPFCKVVFNKYLREKGKRAKKESIQKAKKKLRTKLKAYNCLQKLQVLSKHQNQKKGARISPAPCSVHCTLSSPSVIQGHDQSQFQFLLAHFWTIFRN